MAPLTWAFEWQWEPVATSSDWGWPAVARQPPQRKQPTKTMMLEGSLEATEEGSKTQPEADQETASWVQATKERLESGGAVRGALDSQ